MRLMVALAAIGLMTGVPAVAADAPRMLTLERVFASPDLAGAQPQALKLSPDGTILTSVRPRADERTRYDLWAVDTQTGKAWMLVDSKKAGTGATLSEAEKMQRERDRTLTGKTGILSYAWASNGSGVLFPLDGDLYFASKAGEVAKLSGVPRGALNPSFSPRGSYVGFVSNGNFYAGSMLVTGPGGGAAPVRLTPDGGETVHWGEAEFVADEEMDRRIGYWWSPDESRIAITRFDEAPVGIVTRAAIGATETRIVQQRYPAAGTPNVLIELWLMAPDGSGRVKVDLGSDPDIYLARVDWAPDGSALYVQRQNRGQTRLDVLKVDPATGKSMILFSEQARTWVELTDNYRFLTDGSVLWWSERDGYGHYYRFARGRWRQLTTGAWQDGKLIGVDEAGGSFVFEGRADGVLENQLYRAPLKSPGNPVRLSEPGWFNEGVANADASRLIVKRSSPEQPPQFYLADGGGRRMLWISENRVTGDHPYAPYLTQHRPTRFGTIKAADGSDLYWEMITPPLEPRKRYPVFFQHYGGPTSQQISVAWQNLLAQYWVSRGWIWFVIDNRGTPNRGRAFLDQAYRALGTIEIADQLAGAKWLKTQDFVDPDRIATYGWSYGGYLTLKLLEQSQHVFAAGVAGAPVTDWALYDTHYTERYLGQPKRDADTYARAGVLDDAAKVSDPLLVVHGMADDNVVLANTTAFAARMQAANRPFEMMLYPGKTHGAARDVHVWTTIEAFLNRTVRDRTPSR